MAPGKYLGAIAYNMLGRLWWLLLVPVAFFIAGVYDWRYAVIGLMLLFLLYPFILTITLMTDGMRPEVVRRAASRMAAFDGDEVELFKSVETEEDEDAEPRFIHLETLRVREFYPSRKLTRLVVGRHPYDIVLIPTESIDEKIFEELSKKIL